MHRSNTAKDHCPAHRRQSRSEQPIAHGALRHGQHDAEALRLLTPQSPPNEGRANIGNSQQNQIPMRQACGVLSVEAKRIGREADFMWLCRLGVVLGGNELLSIVDHYLAQTIGQSKKLIEF